MSNVKALLPVFIILLAAMMGVYVILVMDNKKKVKKVDHTASINKQYRFLYNNFLTRTSFRDVVEQIGNLSIYNFMEVRMVAVKFYTRTMLWSIGLFLGAAIATRDFIATMVAAVFALVVRTVLVTKRIDNIRYALLRQLSTTLSSLYEAYTRCHDIPESINSCGKGRLLQASFNQIYIILTSTDGGKKLEEFRNQSPFRQINTLASISFLLNNEGDTENEKGQSSYQQALLLIKGEVDAEVEKLLVQRTKFNMLEYLPIAPMLFTGILQSFFMTNIPGTSVVYQGMFGYIARLLVVSVGFVSYYIITTINRTSAFNSYDRMRLLDNLLRYKVVDKFVKTVIPKKLKQKEAFNRKIKNALSHKDLAYVYLSKCMWSIVGFVFALFALAVITVSAKQFTYKNIKPLSLLGGKTLTVMEEKSLFEWDCKYINADYLPSDDQLANEVQGILHKSTEMERMEQVERLKKKIATYHGIGFHWWYLCIAYGVAVVFWFLPEGQIALRKFLVKNESQEDVLQMQTLIAILMYTNLDTLDVLHWLEMNSTVHKSALLYSYIEYPSDPEKALNRLKAKSSVPEFHQLCEKLLSTVYEINLHDAFPDLINQREHIMKQRETLQLNAIDVKRRWASYVAMAPLVVLVVGYVLGPIGLVAIQEFTKTMGQLM